MEFRATSGGVGVPCITADSPSRITTLAEHVRAAGFQTLVVETTPLLRPTVDRVLSYLAPKLWFRAVFTSEPQTLGHIIGMAYSHVVLPNRTLRSGGETRLIWGELNCWAYESAPPEECYIVTESGHKRCGTIHVTNGHTHTRLQAFPHKNRGTVLVHLDEPVEVAIHERLAVGRHGRSYGWIRVDALGGNRSASESLHSE